MTHPWQVLVPASAFVTGHRIVQIVNLATYSGSVILAVLSGLWVLRPEERKVEIK